VFCVLCLFETNPNSRKLSLDAPSGRFLRNYSAQIPKHPARFLRLLHVIPMMTKISTHLASRLFWLLFGAGFGVIQILDARMSSVALGLGLVLFGTAWFMHPIVLTRTMGSILSKIEDAEVGPKLLHTALTYSGLACMVVGFVLKYALKL
jgi:uncharacterized protein YjeT (DUF2065 family)